MIKAIIFDADGMVIKEGRFSDFFARDFGVSTEVIVPFFNQEFNNCLIGKADLKETLKPYLSQWKWHENVDGLLDYWFTRQSEVDEGVVEIIMNLRAAGIRCYLATNQEKYRTKYFLQQLGFATLFDGVFSSAFVGYKKPQPEFFEYIAKALAPLQKDEILFCDDREENVSAAKQFNWQGYVYKDLDGFIHRLKDV